MTNTTYTYNGNGGIVKVLTEGWLNEAWKNVNQLVYTYDGNGNMLTELIEYWDANAWLSMYKYTYAYDGNANSIIGMYEENEFDSWQPMLSDLHLFSNQNEIMSLLDIHRYEASFTYINTGITNIEDDNSIVIYPNPATDQLFISISDYQNTTMEIFNIQGQLCHTQTLQSDNTEINIAHLQNGLYLLKIKSQAKVEVRKFIKE